MRAENNLGMREPKLLITADWHLGKTYNSKSLLPFQERILNGLIDIAIDEQVDWFIIAGDVYDKRRPNREEMLVLENLLTRLNDSGINICVIAGNHDGEVLTLYGQLLDKHSNGRVLLVSANNGAGSLPSKLFELNEYVFYGLPYIDRTTCLELLNMKGITVDDQQDFSPLDLLLQHWISELGNPSQTILITHILPTSMTRVESGADEVVGQMITVNPHSLQELNCVLSGHIHRHLTISPNIIFIGSPYHLHPLDKYKPNALLITVSDKLNIREINNIPKIFEKIDISSEDDIEQIAELSPDHYYIIKVSPYNNDDSNSTDNLHTLVLETLPETVTSSIEFKKGSVPVQSLSETAKANDLNQYDPLGLIKTYVKDVHDKDLEEQDINLLKQIIENLDNDEAM